MLLVLKYYLYPFNLIPIIKISRLCFLLDSPIGALKMLNTHIENMSDLPEYSDLTVSQKLITPLPIYISKPHGSHHYYSWIAKEFRVFGDLIALITHKTGFQLPYPISDSTTRKFIP